MVRPKLKQGHLFLFGLFPIVENASAIQRRRDRLFVSHDRREIGDWLVTFLNSTHEAVEALQAFDFVGRGIDRKRLQTFEPFDFVRVAEPCLI